MFSCVLCSDSQEYCYRSNFCSKCLEIKKVVDLYGITLVSDSVKYIFVRDAVPVGNRQALVKTGDSSHKKK